MANLEDKAFERDKGFLVKLVAGVLAALVVGVLLAYQLTSGAAGCAMKVMAPVTPDASSAGPSSN